MFLGLLVGVIILVLITASLIPVATASDEEDRDRIQRPGILDPNENSA